MRAKIDKYISRPEIICDKLPLSSQAKEQIEKDRKEIIDILEGKDKRKIVIVGPCSAWPKTAVLEYAKEIKELQEELKDSFKFILRTYTQKPRTTIGWTGPLNQPDIFKKPDIEEGIRYCRDMMIKVIEIGLPIADEALFTHNSGYFNDVLSWVAIGARSSEDQEHRIYASMLEQPVGMKNPTSGDIKKGINSVIAAQYEHTFLLNGTQVTTHGNEHAHLILRGGNGKPNISKDEISYACELINKSVQNPTIIIDTSHENSIDENGNKNPNLQPKILHNLIELLKEDESINTTVKGFMIESFIKGGKQNLEQASNEGELDLEGVSITDGCIGIEETKHALREAAQILNK